MKSRAQQKRSGLLITFEGIEGSGKSTQHRLLGSWLRESGCEVVDVREPGGTKLGEALRKLLLARSREGIDSRSELFLYLAARSQLVAHAIEPALREGRIVLADRFGDASVAYQGGGRKLGLKRVRDLVLFATGGRRPDRTYLLDLAPEVGLPRIRARGGLDRLEAESLEFHQRVRTAYRKIAAAEPERVRALRASAPIETLADRIRRDFLKHFAQRVVPPL